MKKYIFFFAFLSAAGLVHAQTSQGNMMLGGGLNFASTSYQSGNANDRSGVAFTPSFGYFISDDFALGAELAFASSRTGTGNAKTIENSFAFGPFARYYLFTSNEQFGFFGQAQLAFGTGKRDPAVGNVSKSNAISFAVSPGAAFFFNEHWAVEFYMDLFAISSTDPNTNNDNDKYTDVRFGFNSINPTIGFRYHF